MAIDITQHSLPQLAKVMSNVQFWLICMLLACFLPLTVHPKPVDVWYVSKDTIIFVVSVFMILAFGTLQECQAQFRRNSRTIRRILDSSISESDEREFYRFIIVDEHYWNMITNVIRTGGALASLGLGILLIAIPHQKASAVVGIACLTVAISWAAVKGDMARGRDVMNELRHSIRCNE